MEDCARTIIECRQVLKWTYPVGFYASSFLDNHQIELFKHQQSLLEEECEKTQEILEENKQRFLDDREDRKEFYKYKSQVMTLMEIL